MTRTKLIIAAVLVSVLAIASLAQARPSGLHGTGMLTLDASDAGGKILARGTFSPVRPAMCPPGGRTVWLLGEDATGTDTTNSQGKYSITSNSLPRGRYNVYTYVFGFMGGPYGDSYICKDARSPHRIVRLR